MARGDRGPSRLYRPIDPAEFHGIHKPRGIGGRRPKLKPWQVSYAKHARQLRRALWRRIKNDLCDAAVAKKFNVSPATVTNSVIDKYTAFRDFTRDRHEQA